MPRYSPNRQTDLVNTAFLSATLGKLAAPSKLGRIEFTLESEVGFF
jgi:hypothetical protein